MLRPILVVALLAILAALLCAPGDRRRSRRRREHGPDDAGTDDAAGASSEDEVRHADFPFEVTIVTGTNRAFDADGVFPGDHVVVARGPQLIALARARELRPLVHSEEPHPVRAGARAPLTLRLQER